MFGIGDADWHRITRGSVLPDTLRVALGHVGENYRRFARLAKQRRGAAEVRRDLQAVARHAAKLLKEVNGLDDAARMALTDVAAINAGPTSRRDAWLRLDDHAAKIAELAFWLRAAADHVSVEQPGPAVSADLVRWLVGGFAHAYRDTVGTPMTHEADVLRLLGDFVALVDPEITPRSLNAARKDVLRSLHN